MAPKKATKPAVTSKASTAVKQTISKVKDSKEQTHMVKKAKGPSTLSGPIKAAMQMQMDMHSESVQKGAMGKPSSSAKDVPAKEKATELAAKEKAKQQAVKDKAKAKEMEAKEKAKAKALAAKEKAKLAKEAQAAKEEAKLQRAEEMETKRAIAAVAKFEAKEKAKQEREERVKRARLAQQEAEEETRKFLAKMKEEEETMHHMPAELDHDGQRDAEEAGRMPVDDNVGITMPSTDELPEQEVSPMQTEPAAEIGAAAAAYDTCGLGGEAHTGSGADTAPVDAGMELDVEARIHDAEAELEATDEAKGESESESQVDAETHEAAETSEHEAEYVADIARHDIGDDDAEDDGVPDGDFQMEATPREVETAVEEIAPGNMAEDDAETRVMSVVEPDAEVQVKAIVGEPAVPVLNDAEAKDEGMDEATGEVAELEGGARVDAAVVEEAMDIAAANEANSAAQEDAQAEVVNGASNEDGVHAEATDCETEPAAENDTVVQDEGIHEPNGQTEALADAGTEVDAAELDIQVAAQPQEVVAAAEDEAEDPDAANDASCVAKGDAEAEAMDVAVPEAVVQVEATAFEPEAPVEHDAVAKGGGMDDAHADEPEGDVQMDAQPQEVVPVDVGAANEASCVAKEDAEAEVMDVAEPEAAVQVEATAFEPEAPNENDVEVRDESMADVDAPEPEGDVQMEAQPHEVLAAVDDEAEDTDAPNEASVAKEDAEAEVMDVAVPEAAVQVETTTAEPEAHAEKEAEARDDGMADVKAVEPEEDGQVEAQPQEVLVAVDNEVEDVAAADDASCVAKEDAEASVLDVAEPEAAVQVEATAGEPEAPIENDAVAKDVGMDDICGEAVEPEGDVQVKAQPQDVVAPAEVDAVNVDASNDARCVAKEDAEAEVTDVAVPEATVQVEATAGEPEAPVEKDAVAKGEGMDDVQAVEPEGDVQMEAHAQLAAIQVEPVDVEVANEGSGMARDDFEAEAMDVAEPEAAVQVEATAFEPEALVENDIVAKDVDMADVQAVEPEGDVQMEAQPQLAAIEVEPVDVEAATEATCVARKDAVAEVMDVAEPEAAVQVEATAFEPEAFVKYDAVAKDVGMADVQAAVPEGNVQVEAEPQLAAIEVDAVGVDSANDAGCVAKEDAEAEVIDVVVPEAAVQVEATAVEPEAPTEKDVEVRDEGMADVQAVEPEGDVQMEAHAPLAAFEVDAVGVEAASEANCVAKEDAVAEPMAVAVPEAAVQVEAKTVEPEAPFENEAVAKDVGMADVDAPEPEVNVQVESLPQEVLAAVANEAEKVDAASEASDVAKGDAEIEAVDAVVPELTVQVEGTAGEPDAPVEINVEAKDEGMDDVQAVEPESDVPLEAQPQEVLAAVEDQTEDADAANSASCVAKDDAEVEGMDAAGLEAAVPVQCTACQPEIPFNNDAEAKDECMDDVQAVEPDDDVRTETQPQLAAVEGGAVDVEIADETSCAAKDAAEVEVVDAAVVEAVAQVDATAEPKAPVENDTGAKDVGMDESNGEAPGLEGDVHMEGPPQEVLAAVEDEAVNVEPANEAIGEVEDNTAEVMIDAEAEAAVRVECAACEPEASIEHDAEAKDEGACEASGAAAEFQGDVQMKPQPLDVLAAAEVNAVDVATATVASSAAKNDAVADAMDAALLEAAVEVEATGEPEAPLENDTEATDESMGDYIDQGDKAKPQEPLAAVEGGAMDVEIADKSSCVAKDDYEADSMDAVMPEAAVQVEATACERGAPVENDAEADAGAEVDAFECKGDVQIEATPHHDGLAVVEGEGVDIEAANKASSAPKDDAEAEVVDVAEPEAPVHIEATCEPEAPLENDAEAKDVAMGEASCDAAESDRNVHMEAQPQDLLGALESEAEGVEAANQATAEVDVETEVMDFAVPEATAAMPEFVEANDVGMNGASGKAFELDGAVQMEGQAKEVLAPVQDEAVDVVDASEASIGAKNGAQDQVTCVAEDSAVAEVTDVAVLEAAFQGQAAGEPEATVDLEGEATDEGMGEAGGEAAKPERNIHTEAQPQEVFAAVEGELVEVDVAGRASCVAKDDYEADSMDAVVPEAAVQVEATACEPTAPVEKDVEAEDEGMGEAKMDAAQPEGDVPTEAQPQEVLAAIVDDSIDDEAVNEPSSPGKEDTEAEAMDVAEPEAKKRKTEMPAEVDVQITSVANGGAQAPAQAEVEATSTDEEVDTGATPEDVEEEEEEEDEEEQQHEEDAAMGTACRQDGAAETAGAGESDEGYCEMEL